MDRRTKILNITKFCSVCEQHFSRSNLVNHLRTNTHLIETFEGKSLETSKLYPSYTDFANFLMTLKQSANEDKRLKTKKNAELAAKNSTRTVIKPI